MTWALVRVLGLLASLAPHVEGLSPISTKGSKLYDEDGKQFFVKGLAYTPGREVVNSPDALIDAKQCQIDAGLLRDIGANTIRVYSVLNDEDHDGCMDAFANAGIYVWLDLPTPAKSIQDSKPEWTQDLYDQYTGTVDAFATYNNTLFFTIANEMFGDDESQYDAAPFVKAAVKDVKAFRTARGYRPIPLIYTASDLAKSRAFSSQYLSCGDEEESIEAFGLNVYTWCGDSDYYTSNVDTIYEEFQDLPIPVLFSETGCNAGKGNRKFDDVRAFLGSVLQAVFSGVVVFEWSMHVNHYGIVEYPEEAGRSFPKTLAEYNSLADAFSSMNPTGTSEASYKPSNTPPECPATLSGWATTDSLPTISALDTKTISRLWTLTETSAKSTDNPTSASSSGNTAKTGVPDDVSEKDEDDEKDGVLSENEKGLSGGAIGGIAAGIAVVVLAAAAAAAWFLIRRRRSQRASSRPSDPGLPGNSHPYEKAELPVGSKEVPVRRQEMDGTDRGYQPVLQEYPVELDATRVYELPSESRNREISS